MYDKIKTETLAAFRERYPHGTLEDVTKQVIRYLVYSDVVRSIGGISICNALVIADDVNNELGEIALKEMMRDDNEE